MSLDFSIISWNSNQPIPIKSICHKLKGFNISPKITWNPIPNSKSYILILEDLSVKPNPYIHWYIPYINPSISSIDELNCDDTKTYELNSLADSYLNKNKNMNIKNSLNTHNTLAYFGPCPPNDGINHEYRFVFYAINKNLFDFHNNISEMTNLLQPKTSSEFESYIQKFNDILILQKNQISFFFQNK